MTNQSYPHCVAVSGTVWNTISNTGISKTTNKPFDDFPLEECTYGAPYYITIKERNKIYKFSMTCRARTVSFSQLYGGKISAALSRQHPCDLFDCKYMPLDLLEQAKDGLFYALLGSDKPIVESLQPNLIDQKKALEQEFEGMTDVSFSYADYESTRLELIAEINKMLSEADKEFLLSFESGEPEWSKCCAGDLKDHPSVKWKLQNILKLKENNSKKFASGVEKLRLHLKK